MSIPKRPRLRFFETAKNQRHIVGDDRYLYAQEPPKHRVNVIGTGTIGQEHMRVAALLGRIGVHGIYDSSAHSVDVATEEFSHISDTTLVRYDDLEAACNDPAADALMICTPNRTHIDVVEAAALTGKPLFLEKPMATTLKDARRIVEIAATYPTFIQVGLQYRYKAPYIEARFEALERNTLGKLKTISMSEYRPPFLDKVNQWNKFSEQSGGTLIEKCCHYFDLINLFAEAEPVRVFASGGQAVNFRDFRHRGNAADIDDHAFVVIEYANGIRASFTLNMFCPQFYEELVLCGDEGRLVATETFDFMRSDSSQSKLSVELGENGASRDCEVNYARAIEQSGHHGATYFEHIAFADQLDGRATDCATPIQGLWSIIVAATAETSARSGQPVSVGDIIDKNELGDLLQR